MQLHELVQKYSLSKTYLAKRLDMPLGTFCNKLSEKHTAYFTPDELVKIHNVLSEMCKDIDETEVLNFETAIKKLVQ